MQEIGIRVLPQGNSVHYLIVPNFHMKVETTS